MRFSTVSTDFSTFLLMKTCHEREFSTFQPHFVEKNLQTDLNMETESQGDDKTLIKGVNKQIIEIKCTNNEYFDRALLFVNSRCNMYSGSALEDFAREYASELTEQLSEDKKDSRTSSDRTLRILLAVLLGVLTASALMMALILCR